MILYHGSNMVVSEIELIRCRPYRDFGTGFYLTIYPDQAKRMASRVVRIYGGKENVSVFDYNETLVSDLSIRIFKKPCIEWAKFVMNNRDRDFSDIESPLCNLDTKYDIVIGPVANDDMALLFRQYSQQLITLDILAKGMEYRNLSNQYSFHTEKAITTLKYTGVFDE